MFAIPLQTRRLRLVPAAAPHVRAEIRGARHLGALLGAAVPESWPPGEYDAQAQQWFLDCLEAAGARGAGWYGWYAVLEGEGTRPPTLVAAAGFYGPPGDDGVAELGYSTCPEWQGQGIATEVAAALAAHALKHPRVARVIAHTTLGNAASIAVLRRAGFVDAGPGREPGQRRFEYAPVGDRAAVTWSA